MSLYLESRIAKIKQSVKQYASFLDDQAEQYASSAAFLSETSKIVSLQAIATPRIDKASRRFRDKTAAASFGFRSEIVCRAWSVAAF